MQSHHTFSPSALEHNPRPTEKEILMKSPALCHNIRTKGGRAHG